MPEPKTLEDTNFIDLDDSDLEEKIFPESKSKTQHPTLDKNVMDAMITYIRKGAYITHAANAVGVNVKTLYYWMKKGEDDPDSIYGAFREEMQKAFGSAAVRNELLIQAAAPDDWKAAAWWLAKMFPDIYGKDKVKMELSGPDGLPLQMNDNQPKVIMISDDELKKMMAYQQIIEKVNELPPVELVEECDEGEYTGEDPSEDTSEETKE